MTVLTNSNPPYLLINLNFKNIHSPNCNHNNPHRLANSQQSRPKTEAFAAAKLSNNEQEEEKTEALNHRRSSRRRSVITAILAVSGSQIIANGKPEEAAMAAAAPAQTQRWGTRSMLWERFLGSELSPEESAERLKLTAQGFHTLREMLENFTWRYVLTYIRTKKSYLSHDMKNALVLVPQSQRKSYIDTANQLVDNLSELDNYVRTPKIYESYLYYEKTLKSIDDLVAFLA